MFIVGACDFESQSFCTWNQVSNKFNTSGYDDFDWVLGSGSTPSYGTGPTVDHTKGTALGKKNKNNTRPNSAHSLNYFHHKSDWFTKTQNEILKREILRRKIFHPR